MTRNTLTIHVEYNGDLPRPSVRSQVKQAIDFWYSTFGPDDLLAIDDSEMPTFQMESKEFSIKLTCGAKLEEPPI